MKFCSNCGTENKNGEKFCSNCGATLTAPVKPDLEAETPKEETPVAEEVKKVGPELTLDTASAEAVKEKKPKTGGSFNFINYLLFATIKPSSNYDNNKEKLATPKNALIIAGIIVGAMMILNLLGTVIFNATIKVYDPETWDLVNGASQLNYVELIFKNLLIYAAVVFAIPGVYYLGSLILKKSADYMRMLTVTATSMIPYAVLGLFLSKIMLCFEGEFWIHLSMILVILGALYTLILFFYNMNKEIEVEKGDIAVFYHTACIAIIVIISYFIIYSSLKSSILDMF